ncbi:hypothetical protein FRB90_003556 [Tulasnella sp. 427]|nr:hypothetical protein FRB90_003556 [Tulasnella sp. 427]
MVIEGVCKRYGSDMRVIFYDLAYSGVKSSDGVPSTDLPSIGRDLRAAKAHINKEIDDMVAHLAHRQNRDSSLYRLPVEVSIMLFKEFKPKIPTSKCDSLFDLLLVCRLWHQIITSTPQLWSHFDGTVPYSIAKLVIERSQSHPLTVSCSLSDTEMVSEHKRQLDSVLGLAILNSTRIKTIQIRSRVWLYQGLADLLEADTPMLESLEVEAGIPESSWATTGMSPRSWFALSEGPLLANLVLNNITTPLDAPRLSNLVSLNLRGASVPRSPDTLLDVMMSSQRLERVRITGGRDTSRTDTWEGQLGPRQQVDLDRLEELVLDALPSWFIAALMASISAPRCKTLETWDDGPDSMSRGVVEGLDEMVWRPGSIQAESILCGTSDAGKSIPIIDFLTICIDTTQVVIRTRRQQANMYRKLRFWRDDVDLFVGRIVEVLLGLRHCPYLGFYHIGADNAENTFQLVSPLSLAVERLYLDHLPACRAVVRELSKRDEVDDTGNTGWSYPNLSAIQLLYTSRNEEARSSDADELVSLIERRWGGQDGVAPAEIPALFEVGFRSGSSAYRYMWDVDEDIQNIVPHFTLSDYDLVEWHRKKRWAAGYDSNST